MFCKLSASIDFFSSIQFEEVASGLEVCLKFW